MTVKSKCARNRITRKHSQQKVNYAGEHLKVLGQWRPIQRGHSSSEPFAVPAYILL
jgi:hypothetical protein